MGIYFIAAGNSSNNRDKTLDRSHRVEDIIDLVPPNVRHRLREAFPSGDGVYAWGGSDPRHQKVLTLPQDTYVVDIANADVKQVFRFAFGYRAADHQIQNYFVWDDHVPLEARRPYPLVYFLRNPLRTRRTEAQWFRRAFGIGYANWLPGQKLFSRREVQEAMARTKSTTVEAFLGLPPILYPEGSESSEEVREPSGVIEAPLGSRPLQPEESSVDDEEESVGAPTGQGRGLTGPERKAVERHAMALATAHYRKKGYEVQDVGATESFDLRCRRRRSEFYTEELRVEVKGTTGDGASVLLTFNEVKHAKSRQTRVALFVVSRIQLVGRGTATPQATGGEERVLDPWDVQHGTLKVETYRYTLPPD